jgi:CRISPR/Cas system-associated protein Cas7 (RAMP superfamily)
MSISSNSIRGWMKQEMVENAVKLSNQEVCENAISLLI